MQEPFGSGDFATTHWSLVLAAGEDAASRTTSRRALEELVRAYWYPVYAFVRFRGQTAEDAQDLTQAFFTRVLETQGLAGATPERGRFRSYLLGAVKHFLANEWKRERAVKRGGREAFLEWDALEPEARYRLEPGRVDNLDAAFDRDWAQASVDQARESLGQDYEDRGMGPLFRALEGSLRGEEPAKGPIAEQLGMSEGAVKVALHRLRQRFRELLRAKIAATVAEPEQVEEELRYLVEALRESAPGTSEESGDEL